MKKLFVMLALMVCAITMSAQADTVSYTREETNFTEVQTVQQSSDVKTIYTYAVGNAVYPIWITKNGRCYIIRTSKNGNEYKQYLEESIYREICKELNVEYKTSPNRQSWSNSVFCWLKNHNNYGKAKN